MVCKLSQRFPSCNAAPYLSSYKRHVRLMNAGSVQPTEKYLTGRHGRYLCITLEPYPNAVNSSIPCVLIALLQFARGKRRHSGHYLSR